MSTFRGLVNVVSSIVVALLAYTALKGALNGAYLNGMAFHSSPHSPFPLMAISAMLGILSLLMVLTYRRPQAQGIGRRPSIAFSSVAVLFAAASFTIVACQALGA